MDTEELARKIINSLCNSLNTSTSEFDIIPVSEQQVNKSPVIVVGDKLGLESWCIKFVYRYSHKEFIAWKNLRRDNGLNDASNIRELINLSNFILLINPEFRCVWNFRRSLIISNRIQVEDDLKLSELVLSRKPRNPEAFSYRQFLLQKLLPDISLETFKNELEVTMKSSSKYFRNYYSWSHRVWLMTNFRMQIIETQNNSNPAVKDLFDRLIVEELQTVQNFIKCHVSDFSGYHYLQFITIYLHKSHVAGLNLFELLEEQFHIMNDLLFLYSDRESIFLHRRFLLQIIQKYHNNSLRKFMDNELAILDASDQSDSNRYLVECQRRWLSKRGFTGDILYK